MARKRKRNPFYEKVTIEAIASEGKALARINDIVVFVQGAVPGDVVDIQVSKKRKSYQEGFITAYHKYSADRLEPVCAHFGVCGGCKWQILPYAMQLSAKQQQVSDNFRRLGGLQIPEIAPIVGSKITEFYRNKLEFTFSNRRWITKEEAAEENTEIKNPDALGFHVPRMFDKVVDVEKCWLQPEPSNEIRNRLRDFVKQEGFTFFDIRNHHGLMRNLIIRTASTGELMVVVCFYEDTMDEVNRVMDFLKTTFPQITSLQYIINKKANDSITDQDVVCYSGSDHIYEEMEGLKFKIGAKSFYQTNSEQAYELYKITREFAELTGNEIVYDLYTGTGTIANFVARQAKQVIGIEYVPEAIEDAQVNSQNNSIGNTLFYAGEMKDVLTKEFIDQHGKPDTLILDPPRAGVHASVIDSILYCQPQKIVYVSCNPATQARDLAMLAEAYEITKIQPVDMFPHTHHVENVVQLIKR